MKEFDFIIIGAGAAGLMLADGLGKDPTFSNKKILLLDKNSKNTNDRTWCYWEKGKGAFDDIVCKRWDHVYFGGKAHKKSYAIAPYSYKMVKGLDFYRHFLPRISNYPNVHFRQEAVIAITEETNDTVKIETPSASYSTKQVFNSSFSYDSLGEHPKYPILQQHFIGWFVRTKESAFNPGQATFMDFSVEQKGNTRFMYVLPFSDKEALVEYTLFSPSLLQDEEYEQAIRDYMLSEFNCSEYEITGKEKGSIPMTCYDFSQHNTDRIFYIGTAGGWSKPSTGYTFMNTARKTKVLLEHLKAGKNLSDFQQKSRFWYYDLLLLNILYRKNALGGSIFESLFRKRNPQLIFKFLDEETRWYEDIYIMMAPSPIPFIRSLGRHLFWALTGKKKQW